MFWPPRRYHHIRERLGEFSRNTWGFHSTKSAGQIPAYSSRIGMEPATIVDTVGARKLGRVMIQGASSAASFTPGLFYAMRGACPDCKVLASACVEL